MFASKLHPRTRRRGVVLVVILGMLGLLALIGVTFATFSGQSAINARNFALAKTFPDAGEMMDYALAQLIDDTTNPQSVLRGHSLKRDMYGNDATAFGYLTAFPDGSSNLFFTGFGASPTTGPFTGAIVAHTNIPVGAPAFYPYTNFQTRTYGVAPNQVTVPNDYFTRWIVRFSGFANGATYNVGQTYEVLADDSQNASGFRTFYLAPTNPNQPAQLAQIQGYASPEAPAVTGSVLGNAGPPTGVPFVLDGRFLRAFNGPGMSTLGVDGQGHSMSEYANFRYNGNVITGAGAGPGYGDPNLTVSMDEDYDACDLENWFLAIQSADGQVVVPSFHRPGILSPQDWSPNVYLNAPFNSQLAFTRSYSKLLRPRAADGHSPISFPDLTPDPTTGKITYDVDNDGDDTTDSVWLDLGYPPQSNNEGQLFKPMFSFLVVGLNGRLPLNTAGNLQNLVGRVGFPNFTHASHLGNSPSEIDITFALQNAFDPLASSAANPFIFNSGNPYTQVDNSNAYSSTYAVPPGPDRQLEVKVTQLRNILTGTRLPDPNFDPNATTPGTPSLNGDINFVMVNGRAVMLPNNVYDAADYSVNNTVVTRTTKPIAGRWGEEGGVPTQLPVYTTGNPTGTPPTFNTYVFNNAIRAGQSLVNNGAYDIRDDNYNAFDLWPTPATGENADYYDASGSLSLPVERIRRFVTPIDISGDGRIITFANSTRAEFGADEFGRVGFLHYFRPPGVVVAALGNGTTPYVLATSGNGAGTIPDRNPPTTLLGTNAYHGFESFRNPTSLGGQTGLFLGGMPSNINGTGPVTPVYSGGTAGTVPSYTSVPGTNNFAVNSDPTYISPGLNEADEMRLYGPSRLDYAFGPSDLEWLYRSQDIDGSSLDSRLKYLAPISFTNPLDGLRRRRLFALDAWETTNLVWANDNPGNAFTNNSSFLPLVDAGYANFSALAPTPTPQLAHRDRKINLNYPLPVSNSPVEPIRQKWIRETYTLLKQILPPKAVDTPEELAQLSQYVVNIVDFRDPDATCTKFVNTDVLLAYPQNPAQAISTTNIQLTPPNNSTAPVLVFTSTAKSATGVTLQPYVAYDPTITELRVASTLFGNTADQNPNNFLIQYGMENQPVAINEVMAISTYTKNQPATQGNPIAANWVTAMLFELVNTLTKDALPNVPLTPDSSDLDLSGWDVVVMPEDGYGRPDPYTGQIINTDSTKFGNIHVYPLGSTSTTTSPTKIGAPVTAGTPLATPIPALLAANTNADGFNSGTGGGNNGTNTNYYYVFGNNPTTTAAAGQNTYSPPKVFPTPTQLLDLTSEITGKENQYFWLYIRRPPNPFDQRFDPADPNYNRIVVDSFRFAYMRSLGTGYTDNNGDHIDIQPTEKALFSLERMQPLRGGHAVPPLVGATYPSDIVVPAYGYSEQTSVPSLGTNLFGAYGSVNTTARIANSLGTSNSSRDSTPFEQWDYFMFNDRDFTSVAELLMVPGTPPGLFTKQFGEQPPPIDWTLKTGITPPAGVMQYSWRSTGSPFTGPATLKNPMFDVTAWNTVGPWHDAAGTGNVYGVAPSKFVANGSAHVFPYLNDEFFYTATQEFAWPTPPGIIPPPNYVPPYQSQDPVASGRYVGGPSGAGWHKMFEFFEVPSPAFGSIGPVAQGANYDWLRQDTKPGLLNLNLIIDEEVFLGLMGDYFYASLNQQQLLPPAPVTPAVVTQVEPTVGGVLASYNMVNTGYLDNYTVSGGALNANWGNYLKAAFSDFLKLRHGGSGYLFGFGRGSTGQNGLPAGGNPTPLAPERPFRALSYPDIDATVLRPAALPPSNFTVGVDGTTPLHGMAINALPAYPTPSYLNPNTAFNVILDPGVKNPYLFTSYGPVQPPALPPRRLFQISDWWGTFPSGDTTVNPQVPAQQTTGQYFAPSNASAAQNSNNGTGDPYVNTQVGDPNLSYANIDLTAPAVKYLPPSSTTPRYQTATLGGGGNGSGSGANFGGAGSPAIPDQRDHPYFRTEMLQRMMNLTTVRTHQYAVWITVGFFEVLKQGDPLLVSANPAAAYDVLGLELGVLDGKNVRYRGFFLIDRTRAQGFNPFLPGNFQDCVVYRHLIE
jgi:hypothetical protein